MEMTYNDSKSQFEEDLVVYNFFKLTEKPDFIGKILDIGANDGITLSNSYALIKLGWYADLVEPSPKAFKRLEELYKNNSNVKLHNLAIGSINGEIDFYEADKADKTIIESDNIGLLSSLHYNWSLNYNKVVSFEKIKVNSMTFNYFLSQIENKQWDFITIDTEGYDYDVFRQINIDRVNCKCLCIEYTEYTKDKILQLAQLRGMKLIHDTSHNLIFVK